MPDKIMVCIVCESTFVFKESDQKRYMRLGFEDPKRCPECRRKGRKSLTSAKPRNREGR